MHLEITLFGTSACHLCDEAFAILQPVAHKLGANLSVIDIAGDESLEALYALSIPVVRVTGHAELLCWPFSTESVMAFCLRR